MFNTGTTPSDAHPADIVSHPAPTRAATLKHECDYSFYGFKLNLWEESLKRGLLSSIFLTTEVCEKALWGFLRGGQVVVGSTGIEHNQRASESKLPDYPERGCTTASSCVVSDQPVSVQTRTVYLLCASSNVCLTPHSQICTKASSSAPAWRVARPRFKTSYSRRTRLAFMARLHEMIKRRSS